MELEPIEKTKFTLQNDGHASLKIILNKRRLTEEGLKAGDQIWVEYSKIINKKK